MSEDSTYAPSAATGLHVDFGDDIAADERQRIKRSIAAMARYSVEGRERQREVDAHADAVRAAMAAPLNKLIAADSAAMEAITSAIAQQQHHAQQLPMNRPAFPVAGPQNFLLDAPLGARAIEVFEPPFHFMWHWHAGDPPPAEIAQVDRPTGSIGIGAHTGINGDRQASHHAGFGVSLSTDRPRSVKARALRRTSHHYYASSAGFDGSATVEGGTDIGVMENGQLLRFAQDKVFRKRCSGTEYDLVTTDGFATGNSLEVSWTMLPGSRYEFNVGAWVWCATQQPSLLPDTSHASASVQAQVLAMVIES